MTTARTLAMEVFAKSFARQGFTSELVDGVAAMHPTLSNQDRRFLTQLVFGVTRRRGTLDALLAPFVTRSLVNVEPVLQDVLRLGAFQLVFLTQIPKHAAVHETVELADWAGRPAAKGFLNGVLRRVAEAVTDDYTDHARPDAVPVEPGQRTGNRYGAPADRRYRRLTRPLLPDPHADPLGYLADGFSWPRWLAGRWLPRHGPSECFRLGFWFNAPPPTWLRVNKLKLDREAYRVQLAARNLDAEPGRHPQALKLLDAVPVRDLPGYAAGEFSVQDAASMEVVTALGPQPGWRVLDLCSAPGGKSTHAAELMRDRGHVLACDISPDRLSTVGTLVRRLGASIVEPKLLAEGETLLPGSFDAAIVDVPCSNTGVLGRRPEVRWRLQPNEFPHLIRLQTRLLFMALEAVKPDGVVVYSTCSIEPDENAGVVAAVRRGMPNVRVEAEATAIPGRPSDGGYWCRLRSG